MPGRPLVLSLATMGLAARGPAPAFMDEDCRLGGAFEPASIIDTLFRDLFSDGAVVPTSSAVPIDHVGIS